VSQPSPDDAARLFRLLTAGPLQEESLTGAAFDHAQFELDFARGLKNRYLHLAVALNDLSSVDYTNPGAEREIVACHDALRALLLRISDNRPQECELGELNRWDDKDDCRLKSRIDALRHTERLSECPDGHNNWLRPWRGDIQE
jgi:hypothetical protein